MKKGGWVEKLVLATGPPLAAGLIRNLRRLQKIDFVGEEHPKALWEQGEPVILAFWHDQLFLMVQGYRGPEARILISASRDGELIARTMACFGQGAVRGSSRRGGRAAFRELVELGKAPFDLVITPDGPKGPRHEIKEGVVQLARLTGRAVIPMAFHCSRGHRFASWDRFLLPYPFGRGVYSFGAPLRYTPGMDAEAFRTQLSEAMAENCAAGRRHLESYGLSAV